MIDTGKTLQLIEWAALFMHNHILRGMGAERVKDMD